MKKSLNLISILLITIFVSSHASAKDLTSRLGIGIKNNTSRSLPALAAVYYPSADLGLTGGAGIDTQKDASAFNLNVGLRRILFREDNMNFYFGGQAGLVNYETAGVKESGFELNVVLARAAVFGVYL
jgi:hypothetical protein